MWDKWLISKKWCRVELRGAFSTYYIESGNREGEETTSGMAKVVFFKKDKKVLIKRTLSSSHTYFMSPLHALSEVIDRVERLQCNFS